MSSIIQIIPAPENMYVIYEDNNGTFESRVIGIALWEDSEITLLEVDNSGCVNEVASNVIDVIYK